MTLVHVINDCDALVHLRRSKEQTQERSKDSAIKDYTIKKNSE